MRELKVFTDLAVALTHLCVRDARSRKQIAVAAEINASMLSGYCSGRLVPSIDHLDRLLAAMGFSVYDLASEMDRAGEGRRRVRPELRRGFAKNEDSEAVTAILGRLLEEMRWMIEAEMSGYEPERPRPGQVPQRSIVERTHDKMMELVRADERTGYGPAATRPAPSPEASPQPPEPPEPTPPAKPRRTRGPRKADPA